MTRDRTSSDYELARAPDPNTGNGLNVLLASRLFWISLCAFLFATNIVFAYLYLSAAQANRILIARYAVEQEQKSAIQHALDEARRLISTMAKRTKE
jgi:hypothetical protein